MLFSVFRRSPQACIIQLGLSPEHPDPCSSTALELVSGMNSRALPWPSTHLGRESTSALRIFCQVRHRSRCHLHVLRAPVILRWLEWSQKLDKQCLHRSLTAVCSRFRRLPLAVNPARSDAGLLTSSESAGSNLIVNQACMHEHSSRAGGPKSASAVASLRNSDP